MYKIDKEEFKKNITNNLQLMGTSIEKATKRNI